MRADHQPPTFSKLPIRQSTKTNFYTGAFLISKLPIRQSTKTDFNARAFLISKLPIRQSTFKGCEE